MWETLKGIGLLLLGLWLGAAIFFSGVVAPAAFSVLRSFDLPNATEIAGAIVNRSLGIINQSGFIVGLLLLLIAFMLRRHFGGLTSLFQLTALATMVVLTALGHWLIAARMHALRMGLDVPLDQLALNDPKRLAFASLHHYSVMALAVAMIAGLVAYILLLRGLRN